MSFYSIGPVACAHIHARMAQLLIVWIVAIIDDLEMMSWYGCGLVAEHSSANAVDVSQILVALSPECHVLFGMSVAASVSSLPLKRCRLSPLQTRHFECCQLMINLSHCQKRAFAGRVMRQGCGHLGNGLERTRVVS